ncbi:hypothetical protein ACFX2F_034365 [Malus domestica]
MLRVAGRRLSSFAAVWRSSSQTAPAFVYGGSHLLFITNNSDDDSSSDFASKSPAHFFLNSKILSLVRGFSFEALAPGNDIGIFSDIPATVAAVDLSSIEPDTTVTVKWRGKPVFIKRRTEDDIKLANSVDVQSIRDPQQDAKRVTNPEWLIVVRVCTHLGCILLSNAGDLVVGSAHAMVRTTTFLAGSARGMHHSI